MDTSPEYIKMCKEAEEIQKVWEPDNGDFMICKSDVVEGDYRFIENMCGCFLQEFSITVNNQNRIWLPRQDQLQEMSTHGHFLARFVDFVRVEAWNHGYKDDRPLFFMREDQPFTTMEQLTLGFIMKKEYNKVWDREKWIKSKEVNK